MKLYAKLYIRAMKTVSYSKARNEFAKTLDAVVDDHAPVLATRKDKTPVVMVSLPDYESMQETDYLLSTPANARRLMKSLAEARAGQTRAVTIPK